jgi:mono/diheme cytochrome c family protein
MIRGMQGVILSAAASFVMASLIVSARGAADEPSTAKPAAPTGASQAQSASPTSQTPPPDPKVVARGRKVFLDNCVACHGQDATGGSSANTDLTRSLVVKNDVDGKQFAEFLSDGRPELQMPGFALEAASVKDLAVYLHSISVLKSTPAATPPE